MRLNIINLIENYNLFNYPPLTRFVNSKQSNDPMGLSSSNDILNDCQNYLIFEERLEGSLKLFKNLIETGQHGIIITRSHPDKLITTLQQQRSEQVDMYWLSSEDFDYVIHPWEITLLMNKIENFIHTHERGVILLNGLEYLSTYNDPNKILNLIFHMIEIIGNTDIKFLITIDPLALGNNFLCNIENNSDLCFIPRHTIKEVLN